MSFTEDMYTYTRKMSPMSSVRALEWTLVFDNEFFRKSCLHMHAFYINFELLLHPDILVDLYSLHLGNHFPLLVMTTYYFNYTQKFIFKRILHIKKLFQYFFFKFNINPKSIILQPFL